MKSATRLGTDSLKLTKINPNEYTLDFCLIDRFEHFLQQLTTA